MGDLFSKHEEMQKERQKANIADHEKPAVLVHPASKTEPVEESKATKAMAASKLRGTKRNR